MERRTAPRRTLLRTVGLAGIAGLAGCTMVGDGADRPTDGPADSPTDTQTATMGEPDPPSGATHRIAVAAVDAPPDLPVEPSVSVVTAYATPASPPLLRVDVANPTDEPVVLGEYRDVVFQYVHSVAGTLIWLPHSARSTDGEPAHTPPDYEVAGDGCWRLTDGIAITLEYGTVQVPAGGTLSAIVGLYGDAKADACLAAGTHRFAATYTTAPLSRRDTATDSAHKTTTDSVPLADTADSQQATWGFSLDVETV